MDTYSLDYEGSVPYTFIMDKGSFISSKTGYSNMTSIESFLKDNGILEN